MGCQAGKRENQLTGHIEKQGSSQYGPTQEEGSGKTYILTGLARHRCKRLVEKRTKEDKLKLIQARRNLKNKTGS